ncbi:MAG: NUDIX hydrolase [Acidobacteria bacterium]|nr:NUDIX hydrolase [Acidobacteriota bacterium]
MILRYVAASTRDVVHVFGIPHTAVQLIPATWDTTKELPLVLMHKRSPYKRVSPSAWDFCGGHVEFAERYFIAEPWQSLYRLDNAADDTAVREANEELKCRPPYEFTRGDVHRFQDVGYFECETRTDKAINIEFSTAYVVRIPEGHEVEVWDEDREGVRQLEVRKFTWFDLIKLFAEEPATFADGAGRILGKAQRQPQLAVELEQLIQSVAQLSRVTNNQ